MHFSRAFLGLLIVGFSTVIAHAQQTLYNHISVKDGLPSDYVTAMLFDRTGSFWIATDKGLCRYDGSSMKTITMDDGLTGNMLHALVEDKQGNIWTGGNETGVIKIRGAYSTAIPVGGCIPIGIGIACPGLGNADLYYKNKEN